MKKKVLALALMLALMAGIVPFYQIDWPTVSAASVSSTDFVIENGVLTRYKGSGGDVVIPDTVTEIGVEAFLGDEGREHSVTSVIIPDSVISIGVGAFEFCHGLKSITIPNSIISIGDEAFWACSDLTNINIPASVTSIGNDVFGACMSLTSINVDDKNAYYTSKDGVLFNKILSELVCYPNGKTDKSYTIPNSVTSIGRSTFYGCDLTSLTIPNSVTFIDYGAFELCNSLQDVYYNSSKADWQKIKINGDNECLTEATIHYTEAIQTPLKITSQLTAVTAKNNAWITFTVKASGDGLTYQWQLSDDQGKTWRNSSTKTATYATTLSSKNDGRYVRCIVTDKYGAKVTSNAASMKMTSLKLTVQPVSITAKNNAWLTFTVKASGEGLTYQWQLSDDQGKTWRNSSTKTATYNTTLTTKNSGRYIRCVVTDKYGLSVKSNAAYMKVTSLKITEQPVAVTAKSGDLVTFDVKAQGPGIAYQWQLSDDQGKTWRNSKATTPSYSTTLSSANSGRYLRCIVTDKYGNSVKSNAVYMKISSLKITGQPANATGKKGSLVSFKVTANGPGISYTWQLSNDAGKTWRNSKNTTSTYATTLSDLNNGRYVRCIVTDKYGNRLYSNAASMKIK